MTLRVALIATTLVAAIECAGGFLAHSLALLTDSAHVFLDAVALLIALAAVHLAARPATRRQTFGFGRTEILAALLNGGLLFAITVFIVVEAVRRIMHPVTPEGSLMAAFAGFALVVNGGLSVLLARKMHESLNMRAAVLHVLGDALSSFGVIVGALLIWRYGWSWIDPLLSIVIAAVIVIGVVRIVLEASDVLARERPRARQRRARPRSHSPRRGYRRRARSARLDAGDRKLCALRAHPIARSQHQRRDANLAKRRSCDARRVRDLSRHRAVRVRIVRGRRADRLHPTAAKDNPSGVIGNMNGKAVVLAATRTPFGRLGGALSSLAATTLGAEAIRTALERAKVDRADVDHVIMGQVLQGGAGQAPARQASYKAGLAKTVTSETLNKVCASGMLAVATAARLIDSGDYRLIVAGGMESMSNAPYVLPGARSGYRFGDGKLVDLMIHDGLWDFFFDVTMASQGAQGRRRARPDARDARRVRVPESPARDASARSGSLRATRSCRFASP